MNINNHKSIYSRVNGWSHCLGHLAESAEGEYIKCPVCRENCALNQTTISFALNNVVNAISCDTSSTSSGQTMCDKHHESLQKSWNASFDFQLCCLRIFATWRNIVENPHTDLADKTKVSDDLNDFVNQCLDKEPEQRPGYTELLEHNFIKSFDPVANPHQVKKFCQTLFEKTDEE